MRLFLLAFLVSCAGPAKLETKPATYRDPEVSLLLRGAVAEFLSDCLEYDCPLTRWGTIKSISFGVTTTEEKPFRVGVCNTKINEYGMAVRTITIDEEYFSPSTYDSLALIYHEMAHCLLGKDHDDSPPHKIMNSTLESDKYNREHWDELVEQLFSD